MNEKKNEKSKWRELDGSQANKNPAGQRDDCKQMLTLPFLWMDIKYFNS